MRYPNGGRAWFISLCFAMSFTCLTAVPAISDYATIRNGVITNYSSQDIGLWFDNEYCPPASSNSIHASLIDGHTPYFETTGNPGRGESATVNSRQALDYYRSVAFWTDYSLRPGLRFELWLYQYAFEAEPTRPNWSLGWSATGSASNKWVSVPAPMTSLWQFRVVAVPEPSPFLTLTVYCTALAGLIAKQRRR